MEKQIVSIVEFCEITGLSDYVVRRLIKEGKTVHFYCGNKVYLNYALTMKKIFEES